jgi:hypothetical protein
MWPIRKFLLDAIVNVDALETLMGGLSDEQIEYVFPRKEIQILAAVSEDALEKAKKMIPIRQRLETERSS